MNAGKRRIIEQAGGNFVRKVGRVKLEARGSVLLNAMGEFYSLSS